MTRGAWFIEMWMICDTSSENEKPSLLRTVIAARRSSY
jgi:hypothetical protein